MNKVKVGVLFKTKKNQHRLIIGVKDGVVYFATRGGNAAADYGTIYKKKNSDFVKTSEYVGTVPTPEKNRVLEKYANYIRVNSI